MKNKQKQKFALTHARFDAAHCLTPGLFRGLKKGDRKRLKLNVVYEHGDRRIEISGPEPLGADDLKVLQGLVAMAGPDKRRLSPEPKTENGRQLRLALDTKWDGAYEDAIVVKGSYKALAKEIGYANPRDTKKIRKCIERLWKVSIIAQIGSKRMGFRLLSTYASDNKNGKLYVALNPLIAKAVMGKQYKRVEMSEVRALKTDAAVIIHHRLSGWIDPGKAGRVTINTLCNYVWPEPTTPATARKQRARIRKSLVELKNLGWTITEYAKNKLEIRRPNKPLTTNKPSR